jgi:hypothetical protein
MDTALDPSYDILHFVADVVYFLANFTPKVLYVCWKYPKTTVFLLILFLLVCFVVLVNVGFFVWKIVKAARDMVQRITGF